MKILSIETSCDETSVAIVEKQNDQQLKAKSLIISSSSDLHASTGGIIPEKAAREQLQYIIPALLKALFDAKNKQFTDLKSAYLQAPELLKNSFDAIAVTYGPGLIGSLLVGVETAKTLSMVLNKPIVPVNHLLAHIYANFLNTDFPDNPFPFIGLIVSGGHTDILYFEDHGKFKWLGGTRDDAAGEAMDKIGRVMNLPYPAGPEIEKRARSAIVKKLRFSRPLLNSDDYDFSFSGLKTEVARYIQKQNELTDEEINEICFAVQDSVTEVLTKKTIKAATNHNCNKILLGGGVSANEYLRNNFKTEAKKLNFEIFYPEKIHTTDNAAMIGAFAALNYQPVDWKEIKASPELHLV